MKEKYLINYIENKLNIDDKKQLEEIYNNGYLNNVLKTFQDNRKLPWLDTHL